MANKAGIINSDTGAIVGVPNALVNDAGTWKIVATGGAAGTVPTSRTISTTAPLAGGGDLSADRTLSIHVADATHDGYMTTTQVSTLATASSTATTALANAAAAQATANAAAVKANNLSDLTDAGAARTNLGLGSAATHASTDFATAAQGSLADGAAQKSANLSDLANAGTARTNLGLGSVATLAADTDTTLAADSNANVATQHAVKTYVDNVVTGVMKFKGSTDCSGNPNYPAAKKGEAYVVSVAGKIGGASGLTVEVGDVYVAIADNAGGTQAAVGASWDILQYNLVGALLASNNLSDLTNATTARTNLGLGTAATQNSTAFATAAQGTLADGAAQKSANLSDLANAGTARTNLGLGSAAQLTADTDGTLAANTDSRAATQKATKTYADTKLALTGGSLTGALGINRGGAAVNATDLHIGTGNITISGAVSTRLEPTIATPGNYARTLTFHPTYTGNTGVNAVALQTLPEVGAGASMPLLIGMLSAFIGTATKWIGIYVTPGGGTATTNYDAIFNGGGNVGIGLEAPTAKLHVSGTTKLGATGTALSQVVVYTPTLTPAASVAFGYSEQTFAVTGLATTDTVIINGPAQPAGMATISARVSAADTIAVTFGFTGAGLTPTSGVYRIVAIRS